MSRRGGEIQINDFGGGLHTAIAITELSIRSFNDLNNIVVGPNGDYVRSRYGNTAFNSSAMNSGANVQSLSYFKTIAGTEYLVSVCGNKIFKSDSLDGTMDDISGAVTITAGQDNIWTFLTFNNIHIGFGGISTAPDAPLQWTGSGNAAALSGTPPSAYGAVQANNRVFAFRTAAAPSIVQWCVLGNPQDWTGTGSGSQNVSTADNDSITAMAVLDNSVALVFKENSIHKMLISELISGAFPVYPLFHNVGCAGKHAVVVADGLCYFMTPFGEMKITDGNLIYDENNFPALSNVDNLWASMNTSRYKFIQGKRVVGEDYDHIIWLMTSTSSGTTHDTAMIWDLKNRCWLRHNTGFKMNVITVTQGGVPYTGNYAGLIYKQDDSTVTTDASESSANVDSYITSGWQNFGSYQRNKAVVEAYIAYVTQTSGNLRFSWGYNFNKYQKTEIIDQTSGSSKYSSAVYGVDTYTGNTDAIKRVFPIGNGDVFQYRIRNINSKFKLNALNLIGKRFSEVK